MIKFNGVEMSQRHFFVIAFFFLIFNIKKDLKHTR